MEGVSSLSYGVQRWFKDRTKFELYGGIAVAIAAVAIFSFYRAELTHHHVRVAHAIAYAGCATLFTVIIALVSINFVRRTEWFYDQVKDRLELPSANRGAERAYQRNGRVLWFASMIEPKVLDRFYSYSGAPMKPSDLHKRYPDMRAFWSQPIGYNAECAHALYKLYARENTEFLLRVLKEVQTTEKPTGAAESLPVLCNIAYVATHAESAEARDAWRAEYNRHRPSDKRD